VSTDDWRAEALREVKNAFDGMVKKLPRDWRAEALRELENTVGKMIKDLPRYLPRWANQDRVAKLIADILFINNYLDVHLDEIYASDDPPPITFPHLTPEELEASRRKEEREARKEALETGDFRHLHHMLLYGTLSFESRDLIVAKSEGRFKSPRDRGRPQKKRVQRNERDYLGRGPPEEADLRPDAENLFYVVCGLLKGLYAYQRKNQIDPIALDITVEWLRSINAVKLPDDMPKAEKEKLTVTKRRLKTFMGYSRSSNKRFCLPKPRRSAISVARYLSPIF
jgi:hypothetical protein